MSMSPFSSISQIRGADGLEVAATLGCAGLSEGSSVFTEVLVFRFLCWVETAATTGSLQLQNVHEWPCLPHRRQTRSGRRLSRILSGIAMVDSAKVRRGFQFGLSLTPDLVSRFFSS